MKIIEIGAGTGRYCNNDATIIQFCFQKGKILDERFKALIDPVTYKASSTPEELFVLYRKEDVDELMSSFDVKRLHYLGTDMATNFMRDIVEGMNDEMFEFIIRILFNHNEFFRLSYHLLDINREV